MYHIRSYFYLHFIKHSAHQIMFQTQVLHLNDICIKRHLPIVGTMTCIKATYKVHFISDRHKPNVGSAVNYWCRPTVPNLIEVRFNSFRVETCSDLRTKTTSPLRVLLRVRCSCTENLEPSCYEL